MEGSLRANRGEQGVSLGKHGCGGRDRHLLKRVGRVFRHHRRHRDQCSESLWGPSGSLWAPAWQDEETDQMWKAVRGGG